MSQASNASMSAPGVPPAWPVLLYCHCWETIGSLVRPIIGIDAVDLRGFNLRQACVGGGAVLRVAGRHLDHLRAGLGDCARDAAGVLCMGRGYVGGSSAAPELDDYLVFGALLSRCVGDSGVES